MLAAEKGLPLKPLDKSIKPPEEELLMASGAQWNTGVDDEALGRAPEFQAEPEPPQPRRRRGGLLGWLFGDEEDEPPPPER
jgi:hypothetical protein